MKHSPVALFVYRRPQHTLRTIRALQNNPEASETELVVFSDGPRNNSDRKAVQEVREIVSGTKGFRSVSVVHREKNLGLAESVIDGVTKVLSAHDTIIVVEDDVETSPHFLQYMNDALKLYERDERVISIHGYIYPLVTRAPETFFLKGADCWGWATWKRGWSLFERDGKKLLADLRAKGLGHEFDLHGSYHYTRMLEEQVANKVDSWAIRWHASAFLKDKLTLYPGRSLVRNIGHDDTGSHSGKSRVFNIDLSSTPIQVAKIPVVQDERMLDEFGRFWRSSKPTTVQQWITRMRRILKGLGA
ncbi:MAG: glycosyltransferase [Bacteroidota bacterium]